MKHNIESSLKRFLKRKVKITMGFVVAFMIMGVGVFGADFLQKDAALHINSKTVSINDLNYSLNTETTDKLNQVKNGIVIEGEGTTLNINSENITINHKVLNDTDDTGWSRNAIDIQKSGILNLGNANTKNINITTTTDNDIAVGIKAFRNDGTSGGKVNIQSDNLNIKAKSTNYFAYGIFAYNSTTPEDIGDKGRAEVIINSKNVSIEAEGKEKGVGYSDGIIAWSQGIVKINNGNVSINADNAINTRGNSIVEINAENKAENTVNLNGNIVFEYNEESSGTTIESGVKINLANENSKFTGQVVPTGDVPPAGKDKVTGMALGLSNGGEWENTGDSFVNDLTLNGGVITNKGTDYGIKVDNLLGKGGDINMVAEIGANGTATSGKLAIDKVDNKDAKFNVNYSGEGNLEVSQEEAKKVFEDLAENITVGEGNSFNANAKIEEGLISGEHTAEFVKGQGNEVVVKPNTVTTESNSMVEGMRDLATINVLSWRQEMSSLNERMGELRDSTGSNGVWARVYGGKVENGSKYDNEYQTYQVGYDKKYPVENGNLFVGALVSYTDGKTDYNLGDGENYSVGAGVYATWLNRDGQFADVVLKQSRLHNKFDVRSKNGNLSQHGDYSNWGTSLSGQYGRRFDLDDKFFVEPSVHLTFGRVSSEDYTTSAGVKVEQDTAYTLVGDVGTAVGYKFSDKGNVYARASLVKEFKGDIDTKYSYGGKSEYTSENLSDTWGEFGVGVNYRIRENVNMYVDIQRTEEATVENKWQANLGFRWEF
nr:autotransporter outer membrane beta-barrel domain-containing protein [uncultured Fusobacterium sp.]